MLTNTVPGKLKMRNNMKVWHRKCGTKMQGRKGETAICGAVDARMESAALEKSKEKSMGKIPCTNNYGRLQSSRVQES